MLSILLAVIYVAFISLGLPDAILGSAWPSMYKQLSVPVSYAGVLSMIIAGGTIISSLLSEKVIRRLGTGIVTAASVAMTAVALLGFSFSGAFWQLCLCAVPYGLGAGSVDAALNNFVALHYKSRHMNWLHCFWGVGAAAGPVVMGLCLSGGLRWNSGYQVIGLIQVALVIGLIFTLPLWTAKSESGTAVEAHGKRGMMDMLKLPGVKPVLAAFFCYCALETTAGLWASSYMVLNRGIAPETRREDGVALLPWDYRRAVFERLRFRQAGRSANGPPGTGARRRRGCHRPSPAGEYRTLFRPHGDGPRLRPDFPMPAACDPGELWRGQLPDHHGHADGKRLYWNDAHAAPLRIYRGTPDGGGVPHIPADLRGGHVCYGGTPQQSARETGRIIF